MTIHETMLSTFAEICAELAVRGSYTGAAVASLTEQVCWENLFHEIRDRAEPVYRENAKHLAVQAIVGKPETGVFISRRVSQPILPLPEDGFVVGFHIQPELGVLFR